MCWTLVRTIERNNGGHVFSALLDGHFDAGEHTENWYDINANEEDTEGLTTGGV